MTRFVLLEVFSLLGGSLSSLSGQQPKLSIQALDLSGAPVQGVQFSVDTTSGSSGRTDVAGKAAIPLASSVKPGSSVDLSLTEPHASKYQLVSPWNRRVLIPPFDSLNYLPVSLYEKGTDFRFGTFVITTAEKVAGNSLPALITTHMDPEKRRREELEKIAKECQINVKDLERAIASILSSDPYELGVKALNQGQYSEAVNQLSRALERAVAGHAPIERVVNAGVFLGVAQFLAGDYRKAAEIYRGVADTVTDDPGMLNSLAIALFRADDLSGAEAGFRRVLEIKKRESLPGSEDLAVAFTNLGFILQENKKCGEAEPYLLDALAIWEKTLLNIDERLAIAYGNVGKAKDCRGDPGAVEYFQKEITIWERVMGPTPPYAEKLYEYARFMYQARKYNLAEQAFQQAVDIWKEKSLNRANVILALRYLARISFEVKDYAAAEVRFSRALKEQADASGIDSLPQVGIYEELLDLYEAKDDAANLERCYIRLLAIRKNEPPSRRHDENVAILTANLAALLYKHGQYERAKPLLEQALLLLERAFPQGPARIDQLIVQFRQSLDSINKVK